MIFAPLATRRYGIQFKRVQVRDWWDAPDWVLHLRARWGCERAKRMDRLSSVSQPRHFHPLVYLGRETVVNGDVWRDLGCWCGDLSGQYVEDRDRDKVWFKQVVGVALGRELTDDEAALVTRKEYEAKIASARQAAGVPGQWIGPDESGGRRYVATRDVQVRFMSEGESDRRLVRPSDWNVADRARCFCGHSFDSHMRGGGTEGGACQYQETVFSDIARDGPSGAKCMCQEYSAAVTRPQEYIALGDGSGLGNDTMVEGERLAPGARQSLAGLPLIAEQDSVVRSDYRDPQTYTFEGFEVTEAEAQGVFKNMVPGSTLNDAIKRIARSKRIEWKRDNPGSKLSPVPPTVGATGRAVRVWDEEI